MSNHLLKKQAFSSDKFKNFRPILNLSFLSKIIEKCVAKQLIAYLDANDLGVTYQSAYRKLHSTEMTLICNHNYISVVLDHKRSVIFRRHLTMLITVYCFHAFLLDLELVVWH